MNSRINMKDLVNTIMLNSDTEVIAEEIILNYLKQHPKLISKYLDAKGLYHVHYRTQDSATDLGGRHACVVLLKSFATEAEAHEWIIKHGEDITGELYVSYDRPMTFFIQYDKNDGLYEVGCEPTNEYLISSKKYPVYAFDDDIYHMLIDEHIYLLGSDDIDHDYYDVIPHWIYYKTDYGFERGADKQALEKIEKAYKRVTKEQGLRYKYDIEEYKENPIKYIAERSK